MRERKEIEEMQEIKEKLQEEIFIANRFGDKLRKVPTNELENLLNLINKLDSEVKDLKYELQKVRKETATEILQKGHEYLMQSTDKACAFAAFIGTMEHDYGVKVEE